MAKGLTKEQMEKYAPSLVSKGKLTKKEFKKLFDKAGYDPSSKHSKGKSGVFNQVWHDIKKHVKNVTKSPKKIAKEIKKGVEKATGDKKGKEKAERRAVNIRKEYGDLLNDPTLWNKWSKEKRHRFSKDVARAEKYGASPFKTLSGLKGHELREKVRATAKEVTQKREDLAKAKKTHEYYKRHPDRAKKDKYNIAEHEVELTGMEPGGSLGALKQIPRYSEEQQKLLSEKTREARKAPEFEKTDLGKKLNRQMAQQIAKGPPSEFKRKEPKLETPTGTGRALQQKVDFKPAKIGEYQDYYESILGRGLEAAAKGKIKEYKEEIIPEVMEAFTGRKDSGAYQNAIVKARSNLDEALLRIQAEYAEKAANLSQTRQGLDINAQQAGTGRGSAQAGYVQGVGLGGYNAATGRYEGRLIGQRIDQQTWQQRNQNYQNAINAARSRGDTYEANRLSREQQALSAQPYENLYIQPQQGGGGGGYFGQNMNVQNTYNPANYFESFLRAAGTAAGTAAGSGMFG